MAGLVVVDTDGGPPSPVRGAKTAFADVVKTVTFDASYPTGGEVLTPASLGLASVLFAIANPSGGYAFEYDIINGKLIAYRGGAASAVLAEETAAVDLSAVSTRIWARGVPA